MKNSTRLTILLVVFTGLLIFYSQKMLREYRQITNQHNAAIYRLYDLIVKQNHDRNHEGEDTVFCPKCQKLRQLREEVSESVKQIDPYTGEITTISHYQLLDLVCKNPFPKGS